MTEIVGYLLTRISNRRYHHLYNSRWKKGEQKAQNSALRLNQIIASFVGAKSLQWPKVNKNKRPLIDLSIEVCYSLFNHTVNPRIVLCTGTICFWL